MGRVFGLVGLVHFMTDDLAAVEVEDEEQVEPAPLHLGGQEGQILSAKSGRLSQCCKTRDTRFGVRHSCQPLHRALGVHCCGPTSLL
jgi:hypothetical protein